MTLTLVQCEGANSKAKLSFSEIISLRQTGRNPTLRLHIENITDPIVRDLRDRARDLVRIAAYIYGADTSKKRWTPKDVYADSWARRFHFVIPVLDLHYWSQPAVSELLRDVLEFLTGDTFSFEFTKGSFTQGQLYLKLSSGPTPPCDLVTLFSGGIDSLAAVVDQVVREGLRPVLVSHRSAPILDSRQKNLVSILRQRFPAWKFPQVSIWGNRIGERSKEQSQRSRAFLYLCLATAVSLELGLNEIRICDNGVVSLNLPRSGQNLGTLVSRSTHPVFLSKFEVMIRDAFQVEIRVANPFLFKTKPDVMGILRDLGHADLIQEAISCTRTEGMTRMQPHCGTCSQCVDRRFSTLAAGIEAHDLPQKYQKDIFSSALDTGEERTHVENYCRFAIELADLSEDQFVLRYPEIQDVVLAIPGETDRIARDLARLHGRHSEGVLRVLREQSDLHWRDFLGGRLPDSSLISMLGRRDHLRDDKAAFARRLGGLLGRDIPKAFQSRPATKETHIQDVAEALLSAAMERLRREVPQLPFGGVTTRPDFADLNDPLFVEMKLVKSKAGLRRITTETTSRTLIYRQQGAFILFLIYDPKHVIPDDEIFSRALEQHGGVWIAISR